MFWLRLLLAVIACAAAYAQSTAQSSVAPELRECYTDVRLLNRNNLPPTTMPVLIDIIRKIEDNPNINLDLRMIATQLLHTYRQDGIVYHQRSANVAPSSIVLPYAPTFHSFHRHRLVLRLVPSNQQILPNTTLPAELKCAIHHMLSTTVDSRLRGDENNCGQLSQLRAQRIGRSIDDDVEIMDLSGRSDDKNGQMQLEPIADVEFTNAERQQDSRSTCPILTGVVNTRWGPVSAGNLIAGIAAGAESQRVSIQELVKDLNPHNTLNAQTVITSIYPATLSGDLAEATLIQGTGGRISIQIGNPGNWNSSQANRFYMLSSGINTEMTDPEIRGDLDGFILGTTLSNTLRTFSSLKLSQLLDMYYTPENGVFNSALRACNRPALTEQQVVTANLITETRGFTAALDAVLPLEGTLVDGIDGLVSSAVSNFQTYTSNNINDLNCDTTSTTRSQTRLRTNLYIALDATWPYQVIYPAISSLVESLEVGKYGSSITLMSALDGRILINKTYSPSDFHLQYTAADHQAYMTGVNLLSTFASVRNMMTAELDSERLTNYVGGNSTVLLFLLNVAGENNANVYQEAQNIRLYVPDLRVIFATATDQQEQLSNLVQDPHRDIITITLSAAGMNADLTMGSVFANIQDVGRRIINPTCGSTFDGATTGLHQITQFIEPGYVNFYRISPNYFYDNNANTQVRISRSGTSTQNLNICHSRAISTPRMNGTFVNVDENAVTCVTFTSANADILVTTLANACDTSSPINTCAPLFISVEAPSTAAELRATCTNSSNCRFPYELGYNIQVQDLVCYSNGTHMVASALFVFLGLIINMLRK